MFTVYVYSYNEAVPGVSIITVGSFNMIIVTTAFYIVTNLTVSIV